VRLDTPSEIIEFAQAHWASGLRSAVLVANPAPEAEAISKSEMEPYIEQANDEAQMQGIHGQAVTPFLLSRINELTKGKSMRANLSLLLNNAHLAAQIAVAMYARQKQRLA